jgi:hypothetical protein
MEDAAAGGMASFFSFAGAVFFTASARFGTLAHKLGARLCSQFTDKYTQKAAQCRC